MSFYTSAGFMENNCGAVETQCLCTLTNFVSGRQTYKQPKPTKISSVLQKEHTILKICLYFDIFTDRHSNLLVRFFLT
jgi:hypothetical protein